MTFITQTDANTFTANNGKGTELTLMKMDAGYWLVVAANAATRAWGSAGKVFWSLEAIEQKYKTFRGLAALLA